MNFWQYIMRAWGNSAGYAYVRTLSASKIALYTGVYIVILSLVHVIFLYAHIQYFVRVTVPVLAQDFPENVQIVLREGKMSLVGASTTGFTVQGSKTNVPVFFDATRTITDGAVLTRVVNSITMYRDMMVFTGRNQEEQLVYPDVDVSIDKAGVLTWATQMTQLFPWLILIALLFLIISNGISAIFMSIFFLCVVRLYTRFSSSSISYREAYAVVCYVLVPTLSITTLSYLTFGFSSFLVTALVGLLCIHYGLKK